MSDRPADSDSDADGGGDGAGTDGTGLTEAMIEATLGDLDAPNALEILGSARLMALRLADVLAGFFPKVDEDFYARLRQEFTDGEILELGAALSVASGWQRMIEAFGIRPDTPRELRDLA
jgi:alkylhydroperoxidase family enzyme